MRRPTALRLDDMEAAIERIELLLSGSSAKNLKADPFKAAAFERFLEIVSDASRHIPEDVKQSRPEVPWRRVADLGNWLRHAYDRTDADILWNIYIVDMERLRTAIRSIRSSLD